MKKHWLRGLLLGVTMALLLSGGVALGASLRFTVDRECVEVNMKEFRLFREVRSFSLEDEGTLATVLVAYVWKARELSIPVEREVLSMLQS